MPLLNMSARSILDVENDCLQQELESENKRQGCHNHRAGRRFHPPRRMADPLVCTEENAKGAQPDTR